MMAGKLDFNKIVLNLIILQLKNNLVVKAQMKDTDILKAQKYQ